jgi:PadR family transcriptional regulator PadR
MTDGLREPAFWILTSLAQGRQHGYAIIREASVLSGGTARLAVTTLYASLERLEKEGAVASDGDDIVDRRLRRYFVLTDAGAERLAAEAERLEGRVRAARARLATRPTAALGGTA